MADETPIERRVWRVGDLAQHIQCLLEDSIGKVWVEGEISNLHTPTSGHVYFTLKDELGQISAVLFRSARRANTTELRDGMKVRVFGLVSAYVKGSSYQIIVEKIEDAGKGSLYEAFEKLRAKLKAEGLFDRPKKPLPLLPQHIGIVTSPTGAAIRDMLKVLNRRFPNLHILLVPVRVQGEGAAQEIALAIDRLNQRGELDVIIVGRGGGSLEDLWCFNEEVVARAIACSKIPIVSAVGHETDFTISDFVADVRAPTPSAAAEMVVQRKDALQEQLIGYRKTLYSALRSYQKDLEKRYVAASGSYVFREPTHALRQHMQHLDHARDRLVTPLSKRMESAHARVSNAKLRLKPYLLQTVERTMGRLAPAAVRMRHAAHQRCHAGQHRVSSIKAQLRALHPKRVLERGYSITRTQSGVIVRAIHQVRRGDLLLTDLADGRIESEVSRTVQEGHDHGREGQ